jgi:uncharacterized membrane protein
MTIAESELVPRPGVPRPELDPRAQRGSKGVNVGPMERVVSVAAGAGLLGIGWKRRMAARLPLLVVGGSLLQRGLTGHCKGYALLGINSAVKGEPGVVLQQCITLLAEPDAVYRVWRNLENLPRFMAHVEEVQSLEGDRTLWKVKAPAGGSVQWVARITEDRPGELLSWATLPGSSIHHSGTVRFTRAPGDRGTEVEVLLRYDAPGGRIGVVLARLLGEEPKRQLSEDLRRFKQLLEAGEIATITPQPSGHRSLLGRVLSPNR